MKNFRTYNLALAFYKECQKVKVNNVVIKNQFERASLSIVLNLAEGVGRESSKDRRRFYRIAMGSLRETQSLLSIMEKQELQVQSDKLGAYLYKLLQNPGGSS